MPDAIEEKLLKYLEQPVEGNFDPAGREEFYFGPNKALIQKDGRVTGSTINKLFSLLTGTSVEQSKNLIYVLTRIVEFCLEYGNDVTITDLVKFSLSKRSGKKGGAFGDVPEQYGVKVKASAMLKKSGRRVVCPICLESQIKDMVRLEPKALGETYRQFKVRMEKEADRWSCAYLTDEFVEHMFEVHGLNVDTTGHVIDKDVP